MVAPARADRLGSGVVSLAEVISDAAARGADAGVLDAGPLEQRRPLLSDSSATALRRCLGDGLELPQLRQGLLFECGGDGGDLLPQRVLLQRSSVLAQAALQLAEVLVQGCG